MHDLILIALGAAATAVLATTVLVIPKAVRQRRERTKQAAALAATDGTPTGPVPTGYFLNGRVDRLIEGQMIVRLSGGNAGHYVLVPDTGQFMVGDRVIVEQYDDGTDEGQWRIGYDTAATL